VGVETLADPQTREYQLVRQNPVEMNNLAPGKNAEVRGLADLLSEFFEDWARLIHQRMASRKGVSEFKTFRPQVIELGGRRLLHVAGELKCRQETEGIVFMQSELAGQLADTDFGFRLKNLQHTERIRHSLDRVLALRLAGTFWHRFPLVRSIDRFFCRAY
jgi:hypothetical protein